MRFYLKKSWRVFYSAVFFFLLLPGICGLWGWADEPMPNVPDERLFLFYATNSNLSEVKKLLEAGVSPDVRDQSKYNEGETALMKVIINENFEMVRLLGDSGADVNAVDERGESALLMAAYIGNVEIARFLVEKGAKVSLATQKGYTPLLVAADRGHLDVVKYLHSQGASLDEKIPNGFTLLMAASKHFPETVKYLIDRGADVNARTDTGVTALMLAARTYNAEAIKVLLEHGAKVSYRTTSGHHALAGLIWGLHRSMSDVEKAMFEKMVEACLQEEPCYQKELQAGLWPVAALVKGNLLLKDQIMEKVFSSDQLLNQKSEEGYTSLDLALAYEQLPGMKQLVVSLKKHGARQRVDEKSLGIFHRVLNREYKKIEAETTAKELKKFHDFYFFIQNYSYYSHASELYKVFQAKGVRFGKSGPFDALYEKGCGESDFDLFDQVFFKEPGRSWYYHAFQKLVSCKPPDAGAYFQRVLKRPRDESFYKFQKEVYERLYRAWRLATSYYGDEKKKLHESMLEFLVKSRFASKKSLLFSSALLHHHSESFDEIDSIETREVILNDIDQKGNNAYHYLFATPEGDWRDKYLVNISSYYNFNRSFKDYRAFEWLLGVHPGFDQANHKGVTPLMLACRHGYYSMAKELIKRGARVNQRDIKNRNAADYALLYGYDSILEFFPEEAVKASRSKYGRLEKEIASGRKADRYYWDYSTKTYLKRRGLNPPGGRAELKRFNYYVLDICALSREVKTKNIEALRVRIKQGYSFNCREAYGGGARNSLLNIAIRQHDPQLVEFLLENGALVRKSCYEIYFLQEPNDEDSIKILELLLRYDKKGAMP